MPTHYSDHYKDINGTRLTLDGSSSRRSTASRRGMLVGVGNAVNGASLYNAAVELAGELGAYHPQFTSLALRNISIRRLGDGRAEYVAEYANLSGRRGRIPSQGRVRFSSVSGSRYPVDIPWADEASSGVLWTPNEVPPMYASFASPTSILSVTKVVTNLSTIDDALADTAKIDRINDAQVTLGGIVFPAESLRYRGTSFELDPGNLIDATITSTFEMRWFADAANNGRGWVNGAYQSTSSAPYWSPTWQLMGATTSFTGLA